MKKQLFVLFLTAVTLFGVFVAPVAYSTAVLAGSAEDAVCDTLGGCDVSSSNTVTSTVGQVINVLSIVAGIITVIMVIIGGLKYITSQGDGGATKSARNTVLYAVIGLVVVAIAQVLVRFVFTKTNQ